MPAPTNTVLKMKDIIAGIEGCSARLQRTNDSLAHLCFPNGAPSQAAQFNAKMNSLRVEIRCIEKLSLESLEFLIDESEYYLSRYIKKIIEDVSRVTTEFKRLIEASLYGRRLSGELGQYVVELERLQWLHEMATRFSNLQGPRAADLKQPQNSPGFCKGALRMINDDDSGLVDKVPKEVLSSEDKWEVRDGGFFLYWKCNSCAFKVRYLVKRSKASTVSTTDLVRNHSGIEYRPSFLVKSHLAISHSESTRKYGCVFCFAEGRPGPSTSYSNGKDLMQHIQSSHNRTASARLFLEKLNVTADGVYLTPRPFDLHLTGT